MEPEDLPHAVPEGPGAGPLPGIDPHPVLDVPLVLPTAQGAHPLGPATIDSDADGRGDTAVLPPAPDASAILGLATDLDGDGGADVLTTLAADGSARTVDVRDPGAAEPGWDPGWGAPAPPAPTLDPLTGRWTREG